MNIDPAKASTPKAPILEEANRFGRGYFDHARECEPKRKKLLAIRDHPTGKLTQHCRMHDNLGAFQQSDEIWIGTMEMIDPNRGVDKDAHSIYLELRRLRPAFAVGAVPCHHRSENPVNSPV